MPSNKKNKNYRDEDIKDQMLFVDDDGNVIDDIDNFLDKPDDELLNSSAEELKQINLINCKAEFLYKSRKYSHIGVASLINSENLNEFIRWIAS